MRVIVKLFASLASFSSAAQPGAPFDIDVAESATVGDLVDKLRIPPEETKITFVNGLIRDMDWVLKQDDEVGIFPPIGGG